MYDVSRNFSRNSLPGDSMPQAQSLASLARYYDGQYPEDNSYANPSQILQGSTHRGDGIEKPDLKHVYDIK